MSRAALYDIVRIFEARMEAISQEYIRVMGRHLRELGAIGPADLNRLAQLERAGKNAEELRRRIAKEARMSLKDVDALLAAAARENAAYAARMAGGGKGLDLIRNPRLLRILRAQAAITRQSMLNLSQTTVEMGKYRNAISVAVQAVQTGAADYASAIRRALRDAAGVELRYPSGVTRRLDTAVRQNVLDGVRSLNQAMMQEIGSQLGADGVEISAHMLCAEDHLPYQGRQYSLKQFEAIQGSLARPFGMWNCKHTMHPIFLGISQPAYSEEDLKKYEAFSTEPVEIGGRTLTRYEWSQRQRAIETAVRKEKDAAIAFEASGDRRGQREAQARIQALTQHYNRITGEAGLEPEYGRMYVSGYRSIKAEDKLTEGTSGGIMNVSTGGRRNEEPLTESQKDECLKIAQEYGMPAERIVFVEDMLTGYFPFADRLYIGTDVYPCGNMEKANYMISNRGTLAHEIVGHRDAYLMGKTQQDDRLEEAQASLRASKAPGLSKEEREILVKDAIDRLPEGVKLDDIIKRLFLEV